MRPAIGIDIHQTFGAGTRRRIGPCPNPIEGADLTVAGRQRQRRVTVR